MKRLDPQHGDVSDPTYLIAYDSCRYTITVKGVLVASVVFDPRGTACVAEALVLALARQHAACLAAQSWRHPGPDKSRIRWMPRAARRAGRDRVAIGCHVGTKAPDGSELAQIRLPQALALALAR